MIELAEERKRETKALEVMVETLGKVARGEATSSFLAKSMRSMVKAQMEKEGASISAIQAFDLKGSGPKKQQ